MKCGEVCKGRLHHMWMVVRGSAVKKDRVSQGVWVGGWGGGTIWTCPWIDAHGMSMVGCCSVDTDAVDECLSLLSLSAH